MEQLNSNIERVIEPNSTIEVLNVGAFYAFVRAYKYVVVSGVATKEKINVPFPFDLYDKDNEKISTGTISPGEKATFKVQSYKMLIRNIYDYEVHIVYSFGSGTVDQLKTNLEMTDRDLKALTLYDKRDFESLNNISQKSTASYEELDKITKIIEAETAADKTPHLIQKYPVFISIDQVENTYFNVFDIDLENDNGTKRPYFISYVDISFDYSQINATNTELCVTNTFNPAMSFGQYDKLKTLNPDTVAVWVNYPWTQRADIKLPTRSKSLMMTGGRVYDDGSFRIDINKKYGTFLSDIFNFIIRTDIVKKANWSAGNRNVAISKYTHLKLNKRAEITRKKLEGTFDFRNYNKCAVQQPAISNPTTMFVVDVCVYGYFLEQDLEE